VYAFGSFNETFGTLSCQSEKRALSRHEDFFRTRNRVKEGIVATTINEIPQVFCLAAVPSNGAGLLPSTGRGRRLRPVSCFRNPPHAGR